MKRFTLFILLSLLWCILSGCAENVEIIAHRGASFLAPENTLASVNLAWQKQADITEIDIYLSADNRIVVIHDTTTKRTSGTDLEVTKTTAARLQQLDVGGFANFKNSKYPPQRIPLLEEVIATIPPGRKLCIDVKCGKRIVPILHEVVASSGKANQIILFHSDLKMLTEFKKLSPSTPAYWLVGTAIDKQTKKPIPHKIELIQTVKDNNLDGLSVQYAGVTKTLADAVRQENLKLYVWTVNDANEAIRLKQLGVTGIITDRPGWIRKKLENYKRDL